MVFVRYLSRLQLVQLDPQIERLFQRPRRKTNEPPIRSVRQFCRTLLPFSLLSPAPPRLPSILSLFSPSPLPAALFPQLSNAPVAAPLPRTPSLSPVPPKKDGRPQKRWLHPPNNKKRRANAAAPPAARPNAFHAPARPRGKSRHHGTPPRQTPPPAPPKKKHEKKAPTAPLPRHPTLRRPFHPPSPKKGHEKRALAALLFPPNVCWISLRLLPVMQGGPRWEPPRFP